MTGYPRVLLIPAAGAAPIELSAGLNRGDARPQPKDFADSYRHRLDYALGMAAKNALDAGRVDDAIASADQLVAFDPSYSQGYGYLMRAQAFRREQEFAQAPPRLWPRLRRGLLDLLHAVAYGQSTSANVPTT